MEIIVNSKPLDFSLTDETNGKDVYDSLNEWALTEGNVVIYFAIDGRSFLDNSLDELRTLDVANIKKIEIDILSAHSYSLSVLMDIVNYLEKATTILNDKVDDDFFKKASEGILWVRQTFLVAVTILKLESEGSYIVQLSKDFEIELFEQQAKGVSAEKDKLLSLVERLKKALYAFFLKANIKIMSLAIGRLSEETIKEVAEDSLVLINMCEVTLRNSAESLQSGRDGDAMSYIKDIVDVLLVLSQFGVAVKKMKIDMKDIKLEHFSDFDDFHKKLNSTLADVENCFKTGDFVALSDIFEYELSDFFSDYKKIFDSYLV